MVYNNIEDIPFCKNRAVIINVGTRVVTTLSLLAAIKNTGFRVLLIDCQYKDIDDWTYFKALDLKIDFDLLSLPLKEHGKTLDFIFNNLNAENILLIDSDLEVRSEKIVPYMMSIIDNPFYFGCGFRHGGLPLKGGVDYTEKCDGYYEERMWIPFILLKVSCIRKALAEGSSFRSRMFFNLFPRHQGLSRKIIRSSNGKCYFKALDFLKMSIHGKKPLVVSYDTGSDLYNHLRYKHYLFLAGMDAETGVEDQFLKHYRGATRNLIFKDKIYTCDINGEAGNIRQRLLENYKFDINDFLANVEKDAR